MENSHRTLFLLTLILFFSNLSIIVFSFEDTLLILEEIKSQYSRRLMVSFNSISTNIGNVNEKKGLKNDLRRKPRSSSNPIQNKIHHWYFYLFFIFFLFLVSSIFILNNLEFNEKREFNIYFLFFFFFVN